MKAKIILTVMIITAVLIAASCASDYEYIYKDEIFKFVKDNHETLDKAPGEIKSLDHQPFYISTTEKRDIESLLSYYDKQNSPDYSSISGLYYGTVNEDGRKTFFSLENGVLSEVLNIYGVPGILIVSDTRFFMGFYYNFEAADKTVIYYGYYYTDDNLPAGYEGEDVSLEKSGNGWTWNDEASDDTYYTERISDNWFYYKMRWA